MFVMRYSLAFDSKKIEHRRFDVIVFGRGLAGLTAAYHAANADEKKSVAVVSNKTTETSSWLAQGGIACAFSEKDSEKKHYNDSITAGAGISGNKVSKILMHETRKRIDELIELGIEFDKGSDGEIDLGLEGGHSENRILHINGDATGQAVTEFMQKLAREEKVTFIDNTFLAELVIERDSIGAITVSEDKQTLFSANSIVIATGGYSSLFSKTTNPPGSTGSGIAAGLRAGLEIADIEFEQFHPTSLPTRIERNFLISESVRGEGAILVNEKMERFLKKSKMKELSTRDILSRKIFQEINSGNKVYLDCRKINGARFRKRFPTIAEELNNQGISTEEDLVPVEPTAHYSIGGIAANEFGKTNISGIYAVGEASCTGVHGGNRLASNSLAEAIAFGALCGEKAVKEKHRKGKFSAVSKPVPENTPNKQAVPVLKNLLWEKCGIVRTKTRLESGLAWIKSQETLFKKAHNVKELETMNSLLLGENMIRQALKREESRGCHYREDFPERNKKLRRHFTVQQTME